MNQQLKRSLNFPHLINKSDLSPFCNYTKSLIWHFSPQVGKEGGMEGGRAGEGGITKVVSGCR